MDSHSPPSPHAQRIRAIKGPEQSEPTAAQAPTSHGLYWPQNHELAQISIPDLLSIVARNALLVIPAERCVVFMYDKAANILSAQVSSAGDLQEEEEQSFAPVMGMISACFLQKRCLRMQEPHMHKSFYKEYDVPADMQMNSIIVAPVILHHRTVGVVELLNRVDPDATSQGVESIHSDETSPRQADDEVEIKLVRTTAVQQRPRPGFSSKDEQKMIQFTSHVAQLLDNKLKLLAQGESQAKLREERAKSAMELLNLMNDKLELQSTMVPSAPVQSAKRLSVPVLQLMDMASTITEEPYQDPDLPSTMDTRDESDHALAPEEAPPQPDDVLLFDADMMKMMVGICRTQALFRGNHLRKVHRLSEALNEHKLKRKKMRSAAVIQRASRRFLARRWRTQRRQAILVIIRSFRAFRFRARLAEQREIKKRQKRQRSMVVEVKPSAELTHHKLVESDVEKFRKRFASAIRIQRVYRGHLARKKVNKMVSNAATAVKNIVKLQSFMRGTMAKVKVERLRQEKRAARAPRLVCMRIAAMDSAEDEMTPLQVPNQAPRSRTCVYPLVNHFFGDEVDSAQAKELGLTQIALHHTSIKHHRRRFVRSREWSPRPLDELDDGGLSIHLETRPLVASPLASPREPGRRAAALQPLRDSTVTRAALARQHPAFVFEVDAKRARRCPGGVQHADDWMPRSKQLKDANVEEERGQDELPPSPASQHRTLRSPSSNQAPLLPLVKSSKLSPTRSSMCPVSNQLQVCFVPAESSRVMPPLHRPLTNASLGAPWPSMDRNERQPAVRIPRRPLTTR